MTRTKCNTCNLYDLYFYTMFPKGILKVKSALAIMQTEQYTTMLLILLVTQFVTVSVLQHNIQPILTVAESLSDLMRQLS